MKAQLSGTNRLLTDIYKKPARFSSILQANGVTPAEIQQFMGSPAKIAKFLTLFLTSMSQTLAQKHGHGVPSAGHMVWFEHPKLKSPKAIAGHCGLTVAQVQKLHCVVIDNTTRLGEEWMVEAADPFCVCAGQIGEAGAKTRAGSTAVGQQD
ncbi:MAG: hypothetical protein R2851_24960 [Caldilineaceae bacterium]